MTLNKKDMQDFFKRLRKLKWQQQPNGKPIKYYLAGEYGSARRRPHYHAIIFNASELDILKAWVHPNKNIPLGKVDIGTVSGASIAYTVKYINKGKWQPDHKNDDREPEFSLMSKKLGSNYLTNETIQFHREDLSRAFVTLEDGIRMAIPRYYKNKIFPTTLSPTQIHQQLIHDSPSILLHLDENKTLLKTQNKIVQKAIENQPKNPMTDLEQFEAKKQLINNFKNKYKKRSDL